MEGTTGTNERQADPRRSAARKYWMRILARVERAVYAYSLRVYHVSSEAAMDARFEERVCICDVPICEAIRLAESGLVRLARHCDDRLPAGWAEDVVEEIRSIRRQIAKNLRSRHYDHQLFAAVTEYFSDAFAALERCLPPEDGMPWLTFDPQKGLLWAESHEFRPPRLTGNATILVDLLRSHPEGLTEGEMMSHRPRIKAPARTLRTLLEKHPGLAGHLILPGKSAGRSGERMVYRLSPSFLAIGAPRYPSILPESPRKLCA